MWLGLLVACGSTSVPSEVADATSDGDAVVESGMPELEDGFTPLPLVDAEPKPDIGLIDGGGLFLCYSCTGDGRTHYCNTSEKFPSLDPVFGDAGACGATSRCKPYPPGCLPSPSCACLKSCSCERAESGDGLVAGCFYP